MLKIIPISAFKDNYIWMLINSFNNSCVIVDPGDAEPVISFIQENQLTPEAILITHHHFDHTGGIDLLAKKYPLDVYGPSNDEMNNLDIKLKENDGVNLKDTQLKFSVIDIPGHTKGHIAYYGHNSIFCGDTLFSAGCGRIFEGTAEQMFDSLKKIAALPEETLVYCAHEYTQNNLKFAARVEPSNQDIQQRIHAVNLQRAANQPSLPSTLKDEKLTNPFLRAEHDSVIHSAAKHANRKLINPVEVFAALREWKNNF